MLHTYPKILMFSCPVWKNGKFYSIDNCTCFFAHNVYRSFQDGGHICKIGLARNGRKSFQDGGHICKIGFYLAKVTTTLFVVVYSTRRIWSVRQHAGANPTWPHSPSTLSLTSGLYILSLNPFDLLPFRSSHQNSMYVKTLLPFLLFTICL